MPLVITSLGGGHTDTYTHILTLFRQHHFLETRYTLAYGRHVPGLKIGEKKAK